MSGRAVRANEASVAATVALLAVWLAAGWGGTLVTTAVTDVGSLVVAGIAASACALAACRSDTDTRPWILMAAACVLWAIGEAKWSWDEIVMRHDVPFPSYADGAYLAAVPVALWALLSFGRWAGRDRVRTLLDGALVAGSLLVVLWAVSLRSIWNAGDETWLAQAVNLAYPVTDLAMVTVALVVMQWGNARDQVALLFLAVGLLTMSVTDVMFTYLTNAGTYSSTDVVSVGWIAAYLLLALGAGRAGTGRSVDSPSADRLEPLGSVLLPYIALGLAITTTAVLLVVGDGLDAFLETNLGVLLFVLVARQAMSLRDNRRLVVRLHETLGELHEREEELEHLALHDGLTGLANRAHLATRAEHMLRSGAAPAVIYIDLDGFKAVNDKFGHATGDQVLVQAAARLGACIRADDVLARFGGDEFVVLVSGGIGAASTCARRIASVFSEPFVLDGEAVHVGATVGIAPATGVGSPDEAVRLADAAMYAAKRTHKGGAVIYPDVALVV